MLWIYGLVILLAGMLYSNYSASWYKQTIGYKGLRPRGYIYYFRGSNPFVVKIGRTISPTSRLRSHRTAMSNGIVVLGVVPVRNPKVAERYIHQLFASSRKHKKAEWFYMTIRLYWFIHVTSDVDLTYRMQTLLERKAYQQHRRSRTSNSSIVRYR